MNRRILEWSRAILTAFINGMPIMIFYLLSTDLVCDALSVTYDKIAGYCFFLPVLLFMIYRKKIKKSYFLVTAHLITMMAYYLLFRRNLTDSIFLVPFLIGLFIYSVVLRSNEKESRPFHPAFLLGFVTVEYFISFLTKHVSETDVIRWMIIGIVMYLIQYYMERFMWMMQSRQSVNEEIPMKELFFSGEKYTGIYIAGMAVILLAVSKVQDLNQLAKRFLHVLNNLIKIIIHFLVALFPKKEPVEEVHIQETIEMTMEEGTFELPPNENVVLETIFNIIFILLAVVIMAGALYLIGKALARLIEALNLNRTPKAGMDMEDRFDSTEKIRKEKRPDWEERPKRLFLSPSEKIRKIYAQAIIVNGGTGLSREKQIYKDSSKTVRELLGLFDAEKREFAEELTKLYEFARYDDHVCTGTEVKRAKELFKLLK